MKQSLILIINQLAGGMNSSAFLHEPEAKHDFDRLMQLCNSYGLNQEETNQIITDFRNGSFCNDHSID